MHQSCDFGGKLSKSLITSVRDLHQFPTRIKSKYHNSCTPLEQLIYFVLYKIPHIKTDSNSKSKFYSDYKINLIKLKVNYCEFAEIHKNEVKVQGTSWWIQVPSIDLFKHHDSAMLDSAC